ncbi:MAG: alpha/beta fold hydrolase [Pirellulaceae bacterium]
MKVVIEMRNRQIFVWCVTWFMLAATTFAQETAIESPQLTVETKETDSGRITSGHFTVYEDRKTQTGRQLELDLVILHATGDDTKPDPVFVLVGGPGQGAATIQEQVADAWMRADRDVVLVNQRGTGGSNRLMLPTQLTDNVQDYLEPIIRPEEIDSAIEELGKDADLRMYSTCDAMDDLNDVRIALGYDKINLIGGSYGTRAALVYIRRHEDSVRTAILNGVAPIEFTNPLYHAESAQYALDKIFERVESDETYREAFPGLRDKFDEILARFDDGPIPVEVTIVDSGEKVTLQLSRDAFASSLRYQMYYMNTSCQVPLLLWRAWEGDFKPFVINSIQRNRALSQSIALGMLLSVTAAEDVARIDPADIPRLTDNTFLGDSRVRRQIENCRNWPKSELPDNYGDPVRSEVPVLILSGEIDPVTPPQWGELCARNFPNSLHIIAPAAHGVGGPCIQSIQEAFMDLGTVEGLDTSCVDDMTLPALELPEDD